MTDSRSLLPAQPDPARTRLADIEAKVAAREEELDAAKRALLQVQSEYFGRVGALYGRLHELEDAAVELEIRMGLRSPSSQTDEESGEAAGGADLMSGAGCGNRAAPSEALKRVFRDLAKAIHPDRAADESTRFRRHSLMAEANRAYAERDEDRLRLILHTWERSPESVIDDGPDGDRLRVERRVAELDQRLIAIEVEFADLHRSAIWRLKTKMDDARRQGWDLLEEIVREVNRQITRASARLAALRRQQPDPGAGPDPEDASGTAW